MPFLIRLFFIFCVMQSLLAGEEWNTIYLASFPRSGNHWVRFMVEEATHIATSSIYRDSDFFHFKQKFPWNGYCTNHGYEGNCRYPTENDPVLIKTHYPFLSRKIEPNPMSAICLIRHPIDAFWSFYNYRLQKKAYLYRGKNIKLNKKSLMEFIEGWKKVYEFWESQPEVLFIRYEDLQADPKFYLGCILKKAGFSFNQEDVNRAVAKYPSYGIPLQHSTHYDEESIEMIKTELADLLARYYNDM